MFDIDQHISISSGSCWILGYHSINYAANPHIYQRNITSIDRFDEQMRYLFQHFQLLPLSQFIDAFKNRSMHIRRNSVAITFDDGYADFSHMAYPVLRKYGIPATVFLSISHILENKTKWDDRLSQILYSFPSERGFLEWFHLHFPAICAESFGELTWTMQRMDYQHLNELMNRIQGFFSDFPSTRIMMSIDELRKLSEDPLIEFGSHTCSHHNLTLLDDEDLIKELRESKSLIESVTGKNISGFCYPYGFFDKRVRDAVLAEGYAYAVSSDQGINTRGSDLYSLKRLLVTDDSVRDLSHRLSAFRLLIKRIMRDRTKNPSKLAKG